MSSHKRKTTPDEKQQMSSTLLRHASAKSSDRRCGRTTARAVRYTVDTMMATTSLNTRLEPCAVSMKSTMAVRKICNAWCEGGGWGWLDE